MSGPTGGTSAVLTITDSFQSDSFQINITPSNGQPNAGITGQVSGNTSIVITLLENTSPKWQIVLTSVSSGSTYTYEYSFASGDLKPSITISDSGIATTGLISDSRIIPTTETNLFWPCIILFIIIVLLALAASYR